MPPLRPVVFEIGKKKGLFVTNIRRGLLIRLISTKMYKN